jgi:putative transposase
MRAQWRKQIRLPAEAYDEHGSIWHVTLGVADRSSRPFADATLAEPTLAAIANHCAARNTILHLGCLMPDHAHLVIQIGSVGLIDVVADLKSRTTRLWWQQGGAGALWQRSFHDHGIRGQRDFEATISYILMNPIRAGLVTEWTDYPYFTGTAIASPDLTPTP